MFYQHHFQHNPFLIVQAQRKFCNPRIQQFHHVIKALLPLQNSVILKTPKSIEEAGKK